MKINQVIDVKPTRSEKEFLRLVLAKVATAKSAPFDVAEKIEFGEVKHTEEYVSVVRYHREIEYSAYISHKVTVKTGKSLLEDSYEFEKWSEEPYLGNASFDIADVSLLSGDGSGDGLYDWGHASSCSWAKRILIDKKTGKPYEHNAEVLNEEHEVSTDSIQVSENEEDAYEILWLDLSTYGEMPGDDQKDIKIFNHKTELQDVKVYKIHSYEVSWTYKGKTYYAKASATEGNDEVLFSCEKLPKGYNLSDMVSAKEKPLVILTNALWILTYLSSLLTLINLWYVPLILIIASLIVTKISNICFEKMHEKMKEECDHKYFTNIVVASLNRAYEKLDLGELNSYETYMISTTIEETKIEIPSAEYISVGLRLGIGIAAMIVMFGIGGAMQA